MARQSHTIVSGRMGSLAMCRTEGTVDLLMAVSLLWNIYAAYICGT